MNSNDGGGANFFDRFMNEFLKDYKLQTLTKEQLIWWQTCMDSVMAESQAYGTNMVTAGLIAARFSYLMLGHDIFEELRAQASDAAKGGGTKNLFAESYGKDKGKQEETDPLDEKIDIDTPLFGDLKTLLEGTDTLD